MPQITVTLDDETYLELVHYCAKGRKSAFVNNAVYEAIKLCTDFRSGIVCPNAMLTYSKGDVVGAKEWVIREQERRARESGEE